MPRQLSPDGDRLLDDVRSLLQAMIADEGISQADLARRLGVSRARVTHLFGGRNITLRSLADVARALGYRVVVSVERADATADATATTTSP